MKDWQDRNPEFAALLNPAFCGALLYSSIKEFESKIATGIPYPLLFLTLPLVLNRKLRESLPETARTRFHIWIQREPYIKIGLSERVKVLVPVTRESLMFLLQRNLVDIVEARVIKKGPTIRGITKVADESEDFPEAFKKARIWGAMASKAGDAETIFMSLGLTI